MLTAEKLDAMTPEEKTELWRQLCVSHYGNFSYRNKAARDLGVSRSSIWRWETDNTVPAMALIILQRWVEDAKAGNLRQLAQHLREAAVQLDAISAGAARRES